MQSVKWRGCACVYIPVVGLSESASWYDEWIREVDKRVAVSIIGH